MTASLVPGSFSVDDTSGTMHWEESIAASLACPGASVTSATIVVEFMMARR